MVARAPDVLPTYADRVEVIVVDDGSTDDPGKLADALATTDPRVRVIHHSPGRGYGGAVRAGLEAATQPYGFFTDGDQQFDVAAFDRPATPLPPGLDAAPGSPPPPASRSPPLTLVPTPHTPSPTPPPP